MRLYNDDNLAPMDLCECGDYRKQHQGGCFCGCRVFRLFQQAVHVAVVR